MISCGHGIENLQYLRRFLGTLLCVTLVEFQLTPSVNFILECCPTQLYHQSLGEYEAGPGR